MDPDQIRSNYQKVLEQSAKAAGVANRAPEEIQLIVVTKGHSLETVQAVVECGATKLGENYVEEAESKIKALAGQTELEWHMIGHIQSRKAQTVCQNFSWVQSLDSLKLAGRLDRFAGEMGIQLPVLLECNVSGETSKFGWPAWESDQWPVLREQFAQIADLPNLDIKGLMTMPPYFENPELARHYFQHLRKLQDYLIKTLPSQSWRELSMGMSGDFMIAIQEGATIIRIGTAILGPRLSTPHEE
jgi:PLP dependent protein